jgi:hypothetical protein
MFAQREELAITDEPKPTPPNSIQPKPTQPGESAATPLLPSPVLPSPVLNTAADNTKAEKRTEENSSIAARRTTSQSPSVEPPPQSADRDMATTRTPENEKTPDAAKAKAGTEDDFGWDDLPITETKDDQDISAQSQEKPSSEEKSLSKQREKLSALKERFNELDHNDDEVLDPAELELHIVLRADKNRNFTIDRDEFDKAVERLKERLFERPTTQELNKIKQAERQIPRPPGPGPGGKGPPPPPFGFPPPGGPGGQNGPGAK